MAAFLSAEDAAAVCGVSPKTVRRWVKSGKLTAAKRGRSFRIAAEAIQPFIGQDIAQVADTQDTGQGTQPIADSAHTGQAIDVARLLDMLNERDRTVMELAGRVGYLQSELHQAREQLALMAPKEEHRASPVEAVASEPTSESETVPVPTVKPWWRFW